MRYLFAVRIIIVAVICLTLIGAPAMPVVAQTSSRAQQIEALSATLVTIGEAIHTAPSLTDAERLALYTQLVGVSNAIVALRNAEGTDTANEDAADVIQLERAVLTYKYKNPTTVEVVAYVASTSPKTLTYDYPQLLEYESFGQRMSAVRQLGSYDIGKEFGISQAQARRLTHITGHNPARANVFFKNSEPAYILADDFGKNSIIQTVDIYPGSGIGSIKLLSDQGETLTITIKKNPKQTDPKESASDDKKYSYQSIFQIDDAINLIDGDPKEGNSGIIIDTLSRDLEKDEILDLFTSLFGRHPLATEIDDYENKILKFMLENGAYLFVGDRAQHTEGDRNCYDESDVLVMKELAGSLLSTMKVQHEPVSEVFQLLAPSFIEERSTQKECKNVEKIF